VSFLCDRATVNIPSSQFGFISNMVLPLYTTLAHISQDITNDQIAHGIENLKKWKALETQDKKKSQAISDDSMSFCSSNKNS